MSSYLNHTELHMKGCWLRDHKRVGCWGGLHLLAPQFSQPVFANQGLALKFTSLPCPFFFFPSNFILVPGKSHFEDFFLNLSISSLSVSPCYPFPSFPSQIQISKSQTRTSFRRSISGKRSSGSAGGESWVLSDRY